MIFPKLSDTMEMKMMIIIMIMMMMVVVVMITMISYNKKIIDNE